MQPPTTRKSYQNIDDFDVNTPMNVNVNVSDSIERPNNVAGGSTLSMVFHSNSMKKPN